MIQLYITHDDENVINKSKTLVAEYDIKFKSSTSITSPSVILKAGNEILNCNYCYITEFNRYYFITDIQVHEKNLISIDTECDVLETYKDDILLSEGNVHTTVAANNFSESVQMEIPQTIEIIDGDVTLEGSSIILTTIGGKMV